MGGDQGREQKAGPDEWRSSMEATGAWLGGARGETQGGEVKRSVVRGGASKGLVRCEAFGGLWVGDIM